MRSTSLLLLTAAACNTGADDSGLGTHRHTLDAPAIAPVSPPSRWDGSYLDESSPGHDWRCPQLRSGEALVVDHGSLKMPWHIANAALGVWWAGFDVGRIRGTVHGDGTTAVAAEITAHELPADMIASDHAAWSSRTGLAELASAVPQLLFRADDDGRHATLIVSGDCIVELGAVGDQPRLPTLDPVENPYPFAGEHITRTHAEELFEVDREPTVSYIFGARVRAVAATAPAHRVVRCNRAECSNDPFGPGWVPVGWFAEPARAVVPGKIVTDTRVEILDPIGFVGSTAQIADSSTPTLDALANTLNGNPSILVVEVDAYAASRDIAQARADTVVAALVARGIAPGRLLATGGVDTSAQPPAPELVIVKRAP